jgi:hypothetical protein
MPLSTGSWSPSPCVVPSLPGCTPLHSSISRCGSWSHFSCPFLPYSSVDHYTFFGFGSINFWNAYWTHVTAVTVTGYLWSLTSMKEFGSFVFAVSGVILAQARGSVLTMDSPSHPSPLLFVKQLPSSCSFSHGCSCLNYRQETHQHLQLPPANT